MQIRGGGEEEGQSFLIQIVGTPLMKLLSGGKKLAWWKSPAYIAYALP